MAANKAVSFLVLALLLLAVAFPVEVVGGGNGYGKGKGNGNGNGNGGNLQPWECSPKCTSRCSRTQYNKACLTFCNKCCAKCLCVPPGFYGNKGACPCYNNWKTKEGGPKCP
ncbi:Protein GAST1 [Dichanthelium oligosanthes]|uniref:Protein GAST1 n=1 Tax=Dichanthelium oligosanthes TaxID=888268 RepID=A0A1E5UXR0_9POAL|nr:Protein GAST1 [Dichanthelium oligosanthes]